MGILKVINNVTLDGVMQAPARADEDTRDGFKYGGWTVRYQNAEIAKKMGEMMTGNGALLFGRRTYLDLFSFWTKQIDNPYTAHLNKVKKYVVSNTIKLPLPWQNSELISGDVNGKIKSLKNSYEQLTIIGSGALIQSLIPANVIDEFVLLVFPIVLGQGHQLFSKDMHLKMEVTGSLSTPSGVIITSYRVT